MSETIATVSWERGDQDFCGNEYSRGHTWTFDGGLSVPASAHLILCRCPGLLLKM